MSDFTYKKVLIRYSQSSLRGYCRPKFKTVKIKKKASLLERIEKALPATSKVMDMHPATLVLIILIIFLGALLFNQMIASLLTK